MNFFTERALPAMITFSFNSSKTMFGVKKEIPMDSVLLVTPKFVEKSV